MLINSTISYIPLFISNRQCHFSTVTNHILNIKFIYEHELNSFDTIPTSSFENFITFDIKNIVTNCKNATLSINHKKRDVSRSVIYNKYNSLYG